MKEGENIIGSGRERLLLMTQSQIPAQKTPGNFFASLNATLSLLDLAVVVLSLKTLYYTELDIPVARSHYEIMKHNSPYSMSLT